MSETNTIELSEEEVQDRLDRLSQLEAREAERRADDTKAYFSDLQDKGYPPALLDFCRSAMLAEEDEETVVEFSETGRSADVKKYSVSELVRGVLDRLPEDKFVKLADDPDPAGDGARTDGTEPNSTVVEENLTDRERIFTTRVGLYGEAETLEAMGLSESEGEEMKKSIVAKKNAAAANGKG